MENYHEIAAANTILAEEVIRDTRIKECWESIGAKVNQVGSLCTGLFMKHLDIDLHIYTDTLSIEESFRAVSQIALNPRVTTISYTNLIDTPEHCIEWHAGYLDKDSRLWQIDMIHILRGSEFDGFAERMAAEISRKLTPEIRDTILRLKYETPDDVKIMGAEYYAAVMTYGIQTYEDLIKWHNADPTRNLLNWLP